ncbi:hypothetical protein Tco_0221103, partial [Tanacetum coccineum]
RETQPPHYEMDLGVGSGRDVGQDVKKRAKAQGVANFFEGFKDFTNILELGLDLLMLITQGELRKKKVKEVRQEHPIINRKEEGMGKVTQRQKSEKGKDGDVVGIHCSS